MKILIFAGGFFPGKTFGGPPVSVDNFCSLMKEYECYIVTSEHDNGTTERYKGIVDGWNDRGNANVLYLSDQEYFSVKTLDRIVKEIKPDVIYLQSLFQDLALLGLIVARKNNVRAILAPRGELCAGAFRKKYKKLPYIYGMRMMGLLRELHYQSTSDEETEAIHTYLKAPYDRIHYLTNIPSIPKCILSHPEKKSGEASFVFLSRIHPKKNLEFALSCLKNANGKIRLDIYGPIEDREYWEKCQRIIQTFPANIKTEYCGIVSHDNIHEVFSKYDAFLFPTLSENYGHVIVEAMLSGCVPIISDQTPWNDIMSFDAGWALPLNNQDEYLRAINLVVGYDNVEMMAKKSHLEVFLEKKLKITEIKMKYEEAFSNINNRGR